jgi:hypothetical protein
MTLLDPVAARRYWFVGTFVAYFALVGLLVCTYPSFRRPIVIAWVLALTPFVETVLEGQVYVLLALVAALAWLALTRKWCLLAGVLIGLVVAFKPMFIVWPVLLLVAGNRRAAVVSLVVAAGFTVAPLALYGPAVYGEWLDVIHTDSVNAQVANASLGGWLSRVGTPGGLALTAGVALVIAVGVWVARRRPSATHTSSVALTTALLASPLAWVGYGVFLLPVFARVRWRPTIVIAAALLVVPRLALQGWADQSVWVAATVGAAYSVAWLLLLARELSWSGADELG